jgi:hypothetical protein
MASGRCGAYAAVMARRGRELALALFLATLCTTAAGAGPSDVETIQLRFRHSYPFCGGLCPDFETRVGPDGSVVTYALRGGEAYRFRASSLQLAAFRRILGAIRPSGERSLDARCERGRLADGTPDPLDDPRPDDVEIFWSGGDAQTRLTACAFTHPEMRRTMESALRALGADPFSGSPARPDD